MSIFNSVQQKRIKRNTFDLSHQRLTTMRMGDLVPVLCEEVLPGDSWNINTSNMLRLAPMAYPIMQKINIFFHAYFVPTRILWENNGDFHTGGEQNASPTVFPYINDTLNDNQDTLADYLGLPHLPDNVAPQQISAVPFAGYQAIYNEYYRDENLIAPVNYNLKDGNNFNTQTHLETLRKRAYAKDYFTSALPFTQKGEEATIPLGSTASVDIGFTQAGRTTIHAIGGVVEEGSDLHAHSDGDLYLNRPTEPDIEARIDNSAQLYGTADLQNATASTITDLRRAFALQRYLERNARSGTRYQEWLEAQFDVKTPDARLQRPEYLGGYSAPIKISSVSQTSSTDATTPQGAEAGQGMAVGTGGNMSYYSTEHGYIYVICSIMPKANYYQGIRKHWRRFDRFDYHLEAFQHVGEEPVYNYEIWANTDGKENEIFGYQSRGASYKFIPNSVHGAFKDSLDQYHMGRKFASRPNLNKDFIECNQSADDIDRVFAIQDEEQFYMQIFHRIKCNRKMAYFSTPI